jgi:hypothetical protein
MAFTSETGRIVEEVKQKGLIPPLEKRWNFSMKEF